jgi:DNA-3-methyladenine glycosylase I
MASYCDYVRNLSPDNVHRRYHDQDYGFPIHDDAGLFERLILEINQAGLSWETILKKAGNFRRAYDDFDIARVAAYGEPERARLLADAGIIRNRLKVNAAVENARRIQALQAESGSFRRWLDARHAELGNDREAWTKLFKKTFVFTGGEIVNEFLVSAGYLPGAHAEDCPAFAAAARRKPAWMRAGA